MNLPNKLTLSRMTLTVLFLVVLFSKFPWSETLALTLFSVAGITDIMDGRIARRDGLVTNFGILMDPLADKVLVCSAFIAFVELGYVAAWMVVVVVVRELAITGLRLLAASKNVVLAAEGYGKHKTISQIVAIVSILVVAAHPQWGAFGKLFAFSVFGEAWVTWFAEAAKWVAVLLTLVSGALYLWHNRDIYLSDV